MDKTGYSIGPVPRELRIPSNIIYGRGAINSLAGYVRGFGKTAFLVTGKRAMKKSGVTDNIIGQLAKENIKAVVFDKVEEDPCLETVDDGVLAARKSGADFVIGLGGGSALDAAKAIAGIFNENCSVREFAVNDKPVTKKGLKFIACPTTSGSGTEVTKNAVLTIKEIPAKKSIRHNYLIPDLAILDAELTISLSPEYTAGCGIDALVHAIEAYTSVNSFELTDTLALRAISLIGESLVEAYRHPQNIEAREKMILASNLAGMAFSNAGLGAAHALAHPVGIYFKIPHGIVNAALITAVMRFNLPRTTESHDCKTVARSLPSRKEKFSNIATALSGNENAKNPQDAITGVENLKQKLGLNRRLRDFGVTKEDFPKLADGIKYSASVKTNPMPCGRKELIEILEMAF